jgi:hypothetical protein
MSDSIKAGWEAGRREADRVHPDRQADGACRRPVLGVRRVRDARNSDRGYL